MPARHPIPRGGIDPIRCRADVIALVDAVVDRPHRPQVLLIALDPRHRGRGILVVDGGEDDSIVEVAELGALAAPSGAAVILVSVRPGRGLDPADAGRWLACDDVLRRRGVDLLEWIVVGDGIGTPRELLRAPPRFRP